ncbi:MAG: hypothetical protein Q9182_004146 [Xanthomendoza sp. 2 TL-2023]
MDDIPPSYEAAIQRDHWTIVAEHISSSDDLCAASRTKSEVVELYDGPHPDWLHAVLVQLPNLQSLVVSQLPFFDHASLLALRAPSKTAPADDEERPLFPLRLLIAAHCTNTTQRSLADALIAFPHLVYLDLSGTLGTRDATVLTKLKHLESIQILKLRGIQLRDEDTYILVDSIGIRVRSLDVRDNLLTDTAVRILLRSCFQSTDSTDNLHGSATRGLSGAAEEDWPSGILKPNPAILDEFQDESFDMRYLQRLTRGLVSRMPSQDQANAGITHLYISGNRLTIQGLSSLVRSSRLHVLDVGTVETARIFHRQPSSPSPITSSFGNLTQGLPGAEKLTLLLAKYASKNLTFLRIDHGIVIKRAIIKEEKLEPDVCELSSDAGLPDFAIGPPAYQLPDDQAERCELPRDSVHFVLSPATGMKPQDLKLTESARIKGNSVFAPEVVGNQDEAVEEEEPVLTATGLGPADQAINGIQSRINRMHDGLGPAAKMVAISPSSSPQLSLSIITKQRQDLWTSQHSQLHGLLPGMLPYLRSITLTDVPCHDESGEVIHAFTRFIKYCASEAEIAKLQIDLESKYSIAPREQGSRPTRLKVDDIFALRSITLEMAAPNVSSLSPALFPSSSGNPQAVSNTFRTKSSTEDTDSEAFWAAQENDFSFFDDEEECGLQSTEPNSRIPLATLSQKMTIPSDDSKSPTIQHPNSASPGKDVVQELIKFRKERKAAYENALKRGERAAEGYWPGEVKIIRWQGGKTAVADYYGNLFDKGYIYR